MTTEVVKPSAPTSAEDIDELLDDPGQGSGNDVGKGAELSSGADVAAPPRDQGSNNDLAGRMSEQARQKWLNRMF